MMSEGWENGGPADNRLGNVIRLGAVGDHFDLPWIGLRLIAGEEPDAVITQLIERGVDRPQAVRRVAEAAENPWVATALARTRRGDKLASLLCALAQQLRQSSPAELVPVENRLTPARFYEQYYFANRPVVVRGWMEEWPALRCWSPAYFAERFGDELLEVMAGRESDARHEEHFSQLLRSMTMRQLADIITGGRGNDIYLVARNRLLEREQFASLRGDYTCPAGVLTGGTGGPARLWCGGAGTITPLHHDSCNILFGQVFGRKLVRLVPPSEIEYMYNDRTCFSDIDLDNIDYLRFPRFRDVTIVQTIVYPGDFLLLPLGWWHQVRSLDVSISLSFRNFAVPGEPVAWDY